MLLLCATAGCIWFASPAGAVTLGITTDGRFFTLDGTPTYLSGVSYYAGTSVSTPSFITQDLDTMVAQGFNWIRVWMFWNINGQNFSVMTPDAVPREPYMSRLKTLITECNQRGMILDASLHRDSDSSIVPANITQHLACVQRLATELLAYRNVYIDVSNERDVGDARFVSLAECGQLITAIKAIDPLRLCTASSVPGSQTELASFRSVAKMDFITPHLCRDAGCAAQTLGTMNQYVSWMNALGFRIPVHFQEPFRRGYASYDPVVEDFYRDNTGAKVAEAAGWCWHNGSSRTSADGRPFRSFLMTDPEGRLYTQIDSVEQTLSAGMADQIGSAIARVRRYQVEYAEQISHQVGARNGFAWSASVAAHAAGFMTFGPYITTVPAGQHQVAWRLKIDTSQGANDLAVTIDVTRANGTQVLASRQLRRADFSASNVYQDFALSFASNAGDVLEFRTQWHDAADITLDWITLTIDPLVDAPVAPVIAEVAPDPDSALPGAAYERQLALTQGTQPITWSVVQAPPGTRVSTIGRVTGWTPGLGDLAEPVTFTIQADNIAGSDTESWQVRVYSRADLDRDGDVDQEDFGPFQTCFSGDARPYDPGCQSADLDGDSDVDPADFGIFSSCLGGSDRTPPC